MLGDETTWKWCGSVDDADFLTNPGSGHKSGSTKMHLDGRKQTSTRYGIDCAAVPFQSVREMVLTSCGMSSSIACNKKNPGTYSWYYMYTRKKEMEKEKRMERGNRETKERLTFDNIALMDFLDVSAKPCITFVGMLNDVCLCCGDHGEEGLSRTKTEDCRQKKRVCKHSTRDTPHTHA